MNRRPSASALSLVVALALGSVLGLSVLSGCTVYRDEDFYQDSYDEDTTNYEDDVTYSEFDDLDYWGQWFELYPYGTVWRPTVVMGWRPYENGQWLWTDLGWTWVSYEPFGWATYHYGFWAYDFVWGWVWIPDYEWQAARVQWIYFEDCVAWAPLPPSGFDPGYPWSDGEFDCWHVVPIGRFADEDVTRYTIAYKERARLKERSTIIYRAPDVTLVESMARRTIRPVKVELVRASRDARVETMKLPEHEAKIVARYREQTERKIRPEDAQTQEREVEPRHDRARDDGSAGEQKPATVDRKERERPQPPAEPPKQPEVKEKPKKERPVKEKPKKEEPKKEEAKKEQPKKEDPQKEDPQKEDPQKERPQRRDPGKKTP